MWIVRSHRSPAAVALFGLAPLRDRLSGALLLIVQSKFEPRRACHNLNFYDRIQFRTP